MKFKANSTEPELYQVRSDTHISLHPDGGYDWDTRIHVMTKEDYPFQTLVKGKWNHAMTASLEKTIEDVVGYMRARSSTCIDAQTVRCYLQQLTGNDKLPAVKIFAKHLKKLGY